MVEELSQLHEEHGVLADRRCGVGVHVVADCPGCREGGGYGPAPGGHRLALLVPVGPIL